jgi:hypothetical protein
MMLKASFDGLDLEQIRTPDSANGREFGDNFMYSAQELAAYLSCERRLGEEKQEQALGVEKLLCCLLVRRRL